MKIALFGLKVLFLTILGRIVFSCLIDSVISRFVAFHITFSEKDKKLIR